MGGEWLDSKNSGVYTYLLGRLVAVGNSLWIMESSEMFQAYIENCNLYCIRLSDFMVDYSLDCVLLQIFMSLFRYK